MIRVLIRARRTLSSESLYAAMSVQSNVQHVHFAEDDENMSSALGHADILLLILDSEDPLDALKASMGVVRSSASAVRVVVLAEKRDPSVVVAAFSSGAKGFFCLENSRLDDLGKCIERVHNGQIWANSEELRLVMDVLERFSSSALPLGVVNALGTRLLSPREEDVVKLLMEGMQNREIARTLNLSGHTIKNYLFNIYEKLGISSRTELLLYILTPRRSIVPLSEEDRSEELSTGTHVMA